MSGDVHVRFCERLCQEDAKASCCTEDEGRPFGTALQGEVSNCHELLWSKALVMNVMVKRRDIDCVMWGLERRAKANRWIKHRSRTTDDTKTVTDSRFGTSMEVTCLLAMRCPVQRRRESNLGFRAELENLGGDAKGEGASGRTVRPRVPMRHRGADCSVVAVKWSNAHGAKGAGHSRHAAWSTGNGRNRRIVTEGASSPWMARAV